MTNILFKTFFFLNLIALAGCALFYTQAVVLPLCFFSPSLTLFLLAIYEPTEEEIQHNIDSPNVGW